MKNDPIIHAPISKIVEAIRNKIPDHEENRFNGVQVYDTPMYDIETITHALASLGGEEENTNAENIRWHYGNPNVRASAHVGKSVYDAKEVERLMVLYASQFSHPSDREIVGVSLKNWIYDKLHECERNHSYELATETVRCWIDEYIKTHPNTTHQSKREVLEDFAYKTFPKDRHDLIPTTIDRYLAEKHKTEKK